MTCITAEAALFILYLRWSLVCPVVGCGGGWFSHEFLSIWGLTHQVFLGSALHVHPHNSPRGTCRSLSQMLLLSSWLQHPLGFWWLQVLKLLYVRATCFLHPRVCLLFIMTEWTSEWIHSSKTSVVWARRRAKLRFLDLSQHGRKVSEAIDCT